MSLPPKLKFVVDISDDAQPKNYYRCCDCEFECHSAKELAHHILLTCHCMLVANNRTFVPRGLQDEIKEQRGDHFYVPAALEIPVQVDIIPHLSEGLLTQDAINARSIDELMTATSEVYQCPSCLKVVESQKSLLAHLYESGHCVMHCWECIKEGRTTVLSFGEGSYGCSLMDHMKGTRQEGPAHISILGVYRKVETFIQGDDKVSFVPNQFKCPECQETVSFTSRLTLAIHLLEHHPVYMTEHGYTDSARCLDCGFKRPLRKMLDHSFEEPEHSIVAIGGKSIEVPMVKKGNDLMTKVNDYHRCVPLFQCPVCYRLLETWEQMHEHIKTTTHTLPHCLECGQQLPYDFEAVIDHLSKEPCCLGSGLTHRLYHSKRYQVIADASDPDVFRLMQEAVKGDAVFEQSVLHEWNARLNGIKMVYQCPLRTCLKVFSGAGELCEHLRSSKHGLTTCPHQGCNMTLRVWEGALKTHEHEIILPLKHHLINKNHIEDYVVWFQVNDLLDYFPSYFTRCDKCELIIDVVSRRHEQSGECAVAQHWRQLKVSGASHAPKGALNPHLVDIGAWKEPKRVVLTAEQRKTVAIEEDFKLHSQ